MIINFVLFVSFVVNLLFFAPFAFFAVKSLPITIFVLPPLSFSPVEYQASTPRGRKYLL